jgi:superfamily II DNA or RNA helicase
MPPYSSRNPRPMKQQTRAWAPQQAPAPIERPSYTPSAYQQAIIDWLLTGTGNALVDAKAGSGKTSTLCMLSDVIPNDARTRAAFLAFNRPLQTS